jgi:hypothetical protein
MNDTQPNSTIYFQILIDSANYKQYPIGKLQGSYVVKITNIQYSVNPSVSADAQCLVRLKSNILQYDNGYPTSDILINHYPNRSDLTNPIYLNARLQTWIDFTITTSVNGAAESAPANFQSILLTCEATKN